MGLTELSGEVGITLANLSILKNNKARATRFSTLPICKALDRQPGDILEFTDEVEPAPRSGRRRTAFRRVSDRGGDDVHRDGGKSEAGPRWPQWPAWPIGLFAASARDFGAAYVGGKWSAAKAFASAITKARSSLSSTRAARRCPAIRRRDPADGQAAVLP